jgi:hypothetical protein
MEHMIYRLDLPQLSECILDGVDDEYFKDNAETHYREAKPNKIFKPEYLKIKNFNWLAVLIFYRNFGASTPVHTDTADMSNTVWGINWIYKGPGLMEYWELDDFESENIQYFEDSLNYPTFRCIPTTPPRLRYFLKPGAYLVNTTKPHKATSFKNRYCVSYRSTTATTPWGEIVDYFSDLIIHDPKILR